LSDLPQILNLGLYDQRELCKCFKWRRPQMEDDLIWKSTSNIKIEISQQLLVGSSQNFKLTLIWPKRTLQIFKWRRPQIENYLKWKTTSNIKSEIYQQLLVGSSPNFKLRLIWPKQILQIFQIRMTSNGRGPQIEDYLKYQNWNISPTTGLIFPKV
jgi:hypothetical protein